MNGKGIDSKDLFSIIPLPFIPLPLFVHLCQYESPGFGNSDFGVRVYDSFFISIIPVLRWKKNLR